MIVASDDIQYGTGHDGRVDLAPVAAAVAHADVVALPAVERSAARTGMPDLAALMSRHHGLDLRPDLPALYL